MDKLTVNRNIDYYCGKEIAFEYVGEFLDDYAIKRNVPLSGIKIAICSDRQVSGYYYNRFENQFIKRGIKPSLISINCDASHKNLSAADELFRALSDFDFGSDDWLIALGGGGVIDVCGFADAIFTGGINFMAVPTTLNAMISGVLTDKARLNSNCYKNEISVPFSPDAVIIDPLFLDTVPGSVKANGTASVIRLALLESPELLMSLVSTTDFRTFIGDVYKVYANVEKMNPQLLTVGNELADAIEMYFRFVKYSEGEALALSLLSVLDDKKRESLSWFYDKMKLPTTLADCSSKMILKSLEKNLRHTGSKGVSIVDYEPKFGGKWVIKDLDVSEAIDIMSARLETVENKD